MTENSWSSVNFPDQTSPCKSHLLHLHAQDVIGPVDHLGPFDHARKSGELLLSVLHAAQISDLRRIASPKFSPDISIGMPGG